MSKMSQITSALKRTGQTIASIMTLGLISNPDDDKSLNCVVQCESKGKAFPVGLFSPYGVSSNAPEGATVVLFNMGGSAQGKIGYASFPENRFRELKEWEVAIGNYKTKANILFADSNEVFFNKDAEEKADDFMVRFTKLKSGFDQLKSDHNALVQQVITHGHLDGVTLAPTTNSVIGTIPPAIPIIITPSAASVDNSKISQFRVPGGTS